MNVKELMAILNTMPQDADVVFYSGCTGLSIIPVQKDDVYKDDVYCETDNTIIFAVPIDFFNDIEH